MVLGAGDARACATDGNAALRVQLTATYWHFLLLVWLLMLALFVAT